jgi:hypothetical protein
MDIDTDKLTKMGYVQLSGVLFMVTKETIRDIVMDRVGWVDFAWTPELIDEHMKRFERALEWGLTDALHEVITDTAVDIEVEENPNA